MGAIAGAWSVSRDAALTDTVQQMTTRLAYRGADAGGTWVAPEWGPVLGHARLPMQELTEADAQPMTSPCGRYVLVLNGGIYNHWELRERLGSDRRWRGRSDTETMLECIAAWGLRGALERVNGVFALALWDTLERRLSLARDRLGEKPLYWGLKDGILVFASELGPILMSGLGPFRVDAEAVSALLNLSYIPDPKSILEHVQKLPPGQTLEVRCTGDSLTCRQEAYWSLAEVIESAVTARPVLSEAAWLERVEGDFERAVRLRLSSDVPLGAFLSGGVDSGLVVATMVKIAATPVRTFTIGMDAEWDEAPRARELADYLGTIHSEIRITHQDCLNVIPKLPRIYTEPFGDSSQIPTYVVCEAARREVTAVLAGDGGDELFAGYHRHFQARRIWGAISRLPRPVHRVLARASASGTGQRAIVAASVFASSGGARGERMLRIQKAGRLMAATSVADLYRRLVTQWPGGQAPAAAGAGWQLPLPRALTEQTRWDPVEHLMAYDLATALPGDMLVKLDRASTANGLEVRVPFLDTDFVMLAMSVPPALKIQAGQGKAILRRSLARHSPPAWMETPAAKRKQGFGIPLAAWLRDDLRDWAEALLSERALRETPFLDATAVRSRWREFINGRAAWEHPLWSVLMLQAWVREHRRWLEFA